MKNVKISKVATTNVKNFGQFNDVRMDVKALKMVKGGVIIIDDNIAG